MLTEFLIAGLVIVSCFALWCMARVCHLVLNQSRQTTEALIGVSSKQGGALAMEMEKTARSEHNGKVPSREEEGVLIMRPAR